MPKENENEEISAKRQNPLFAAAITGGKKETMKIIELVEKE